jgi:hypothetical protein
MTINVSQASLAFHRATFLVHRRDGTTEAVDGILTPDGRLGLHFSHIPVPAVVITHIASGKSLGGFAHLGATLQAMTDLMGMTDWSQVQPIITEEVMACLNKARG